MCECKRGESDDRVHRRADIMGHIGKKRTFRLAGPVGLEACAAAADRPIVYVAHLPIRKLFFQLFAR